MPICGSRKVNKAKVKPSNGLGNVQTSFKKFFRKLPYYKVPTIKALITLLFFNISHLLGVKTSGEQCKHFDAYNLPGFAIEEKQFGGIFAVFCTINIVLK